MNLILEIKGGIGKTIISTAIINSIKRTHPDYNIIVVTAYPQVFKNNPLVKEVFTFANFSQVYYKYCKDQEFKVCGYEPYEHSDFVTRKKGLYDVWANLCGVEYKNEWPQYYIDEKEKIKFKEKYKSDKPIFVLQTHGGDRSQEMDYNWARDLPDSVVEKIINHYKNDYTIYHIKSDWQKSYEHTIPATEGIREIAILISLSQRRLFIDSFAQHLAVALHKPSTVCWISTEPEQFAYKNPITRYPYHFTVKANEPHFETEHSTYSGYSLVESINNLPYANVDSIFEGVDIIEEIEKQKNVFQ